MNATLAHLNLRSRRGFRWIGHGPGRRMARRLARFTFTACDALYGVAVDVSDSHTYTLED